MFTIRRFGYGPPPSTALRTAPPVGSSFGLVAPTTPAPGRPKAPSRTQSDMAARWAEPPLRLRSIPHPTRSIGALAPDQVVDEAGHVVGRQAAHLGRPLERPLAAGGQVLVDALGVLVDEGPVDRAPSLQLRRRAPWPGRRRCPGRTGRMPRGPVGRRRPPGVDDHDLGPVLRPAPRAAGRGGSWTPSGCRPTTTIRSLSATSVGSALAIVPSTSRHALLAVAAQIVCSTSAAPSASNSSGVRPSLSKTDADEL